MPKIKNNVLRARENDTNEYTDIPVVVSEESFAQAKVAEAWANGTKNGVPVPPTDPAYHNNAKYYSEQVAQAVSVDVKEWLDDHPEATTTVQDGSLTESKFADSLKLKTIKEYVTPEMFGAVGDGVTDDSIAMQSAISSNKTVYLTNNKTYLITSPLTISYDNTLIDGHNAKIIYRKEQSETPSHTESLFVIVEKDDVTIKNLHMEYDGTFTVSGDYGGFIFGIYVDQSNRFKAEGLEISHFNNSGIYVGITNVYCEKPLVTNCYLHHNRVAGVAYNYTKDGIVSNCILTYNGSEDSNGTGYGFTGAIAGTPINTIVTNNNASYNYRKGIDFHSGTNGVIANNICVHNRAFGIFVCVHIHGTWNIENNIITDMVSDTNIDGLQTYAIFVGGEDSDPSTATPTTFNIIGNSILNMNKVYGYMAVFGEEMCDIAKGRLNITNNIVDVKSIDRLYSSKNKASYVANYFFDLTFESNQIYVESCDQVPFYVRSKQHRKKIISNNVIDIIASNSTNGFYLRDQTSVPQSCLIFSGNSLNIPETTWTAASGAVQLSRFSRELFTDNVINGTVSREWDGYKFTDSKYVLPTTFYWTKGSIVWNLNLNQNHVGWYCTTAGYGADNVPAGQSVAVWEEWNYDIPPIVVTADSSGGQTVYTADKTVAEILSAINAGADPSAVMGNEVFKLSLADPTTPKLVFASTSFVNSTIVYRALEFTVQSNEDVITLVDSAA